MHLSVIIPTHNTPCDELVRTLHRQLESAQTKTLQQPGRDGAPALQNFEIIIADDGSDNQELLHTYQQLTALPNVRHLALPKAPSRSAMRNRLPGLASYEWQLQLNANVLLPDNDFVLRYLHAMNSQNHADVVCGHTSARAMSHNLRCTYEQSYQASHPAEWRNQHPFDSFRNTNFAIRSELASRIAYDERITGYGYEDLAFGIALRKAGARIKHIDNPAVYDCTETSEQYLQKTEESMHTLLSLPYEVKHEVSVYRKMMQLRSLHLLWLLRLWHRMMQKKERHNLCGAHPSMFVFKLYKLGLLASLL